MIGETVDAGTRNFVRGGLVRDRESDFEIKPALQPTPDVDGSCPVTPVVAAAGEEHRDKIAKSPPMSKEENIDLMALVARPVGKKELTQNPKHKPRSLLSGISL